MTFTVFTTKNKITAKEFIDLAKSVGWGKNKEFNLNMVNSALKKTSLIVTIKNNENETIGCGRTLSDNLFFTTIPDIFIHPKYQKKGLGKLIMQKIIEKYKHTKIFFGSQPGNEIFFEKLGFKKDLQSYAMKNSIK